MGRERVVVAGSLAQRAGRGGHAWVFLQYLLGFQRLGWDVLFLDRLEPEMCSAGDGRRCAPERSVQLRYLHTVMDRFGLGEAYSVSLDRGSRSLGLGRREVLEHVREAAFLLNIMGFCDDQEILANARRRVFVDIDPGFGQIWQAQGLADLFAGHDLHLTIGENIGRPDCSIPLCGIRWVTTPPPVVLDLWEPEAESRAASSETFTTVGSWRGPFGPIEWCGRTLGLRAHEFRRFASVPVLAGGRFLAAMDIHEADAADRRLLEENGWGVLDPAAVAFEPWSYRTFIHGSAAEFMVAKQLYVETRSGWMSDRSLCYLASGKPVVAQDTGFGLRYPTGEGLLVFGTLDEAVSRVQEVRSDYRRHSHAAIEIAREYFDSGRVLGRIVDTVAAT